MKASIEMVNTIDRLLESERNGTAPEGTWQQFLAGASPVELNIHNDYNRDVAQLVALAAQSAKGRPTEYFTKLLKEGKIDPRASKKQRVKGLKELREQHAPDANLKKAYDQVRDNYGARLPEDLRGVSRMRAKENALAQLDPQDFEDGSVFEIYDEKFVVKNGTFRPFKGKK